MFNTAAYAVIDGVQDFKKKVIETTVTHDGVQRALTGFIDAQTKYTKSAADAGLNVMTSLGLILMNKDFYTDMTDQFKAFMPAAVVKKTK